MGISTTIAIAAASAAMVTVPTTTSRLRTPNAISAATPRSATTSIMLRVPLAD